MNIVWLNEEAGQDVPSVGGKVANLNGTEEVSVPRFMRTQATLSEEQLVDMARLAVALEEQMGWPVDMESAYQGDELYLLQCRLITTLTEPGET